jgi:hypothetical protein
VAGNHRNIATDNAKDPRLGTYRTVVRLGPAIGLEPLLLFTHLLCEVPFVA